MAKSIDFGVLINVLKEHQCTPSQWENVKSGDDVVIVACKTCFKRNANINNRK